MAFRCFCNQTFATTRLLYEHCDDNGHFFRCFCGKLFLSESKVIDHHSISHYGQSESCTAIPLDGIGGRKITGSIQCPHCTRCFSGIPALQQHMQYYTQHARLRASGTTSLKQSPVPSPIASGGSLSITTTHSAYRSQPSVIACPQCPMRKFANLLALQSHVASVHPNVSRGQKRQSSHQPERWECSLCGQHYDEVGKLHEHLFGYHCSAKCASCSKEFKTKLRKGLYWAASDQLRTHEEDMQLYVEHSPGKVCRSPAQFFLLSPNEDSRERHWTT
jgi:hypothetical protein